MSNLKFKKNESFYIRDGWFEKAINTINENTDNIFSKNNGISILGIGSNMVKSLKYWLVASNIIESSINKTVLSDLGNLILKYDQYLESNFSWFLIHHNLCKNVTECPLFAELFNSDIKTFTKNDFIKLVQFDLNQMDIIVKKEYIEDDTSVLLKSYFNEALYDNPEDNYICPLSNLKLLEKRNDVYFKSKPLYTSLSYLLVYYCLITTYNEKSFVIEDSLNDLNTPLNIFNLDKNMYLQYLDEMRKKGLITINKTAGLNTVYFEKRLSLEEVFVEYFGGDSNV